MLYFDDKEQPGPRDVEDQDTLDDYVHDIVEHEDKNDSEEE